MPHQARIGFELSDGIGEELTPLVVVHPPECLGDRADGLSLSLPRFGGGGLSTSGTVLVMRRERFVTVPAGMPLLRVLAPVRLKDASSAEDVLVVLLGRDMLVRLPLVSVDIPVDAVFDLAPGVSLTSHPSDGAVAEVVGVDRLLDSSAVSRSTELLPLGRRGHSARVVLPKLSVPVSGELVEERDIVPLWSRVRRAEVIPQGSRGVNDRVAGDDGILQPDGVAVRRVRRQLAIQVDIADTEGPNEASTRARVREELDHRDVPEVEGSITKFGDVFRAEHVVLVDGAIHLLREVVVLGPVAGRRVEDAVEPTNDELEGSDSVVGQPITIPPVGRIVADVVDVLFEVSLGESTDRLVEAASRRPEVLEVRTERGGLHFLVTLLDESFDVGEVLLGVELLSDLPKLAIELVCVPSEVVEPGHDSRETMINNKPQFNYKGVSLLNSDRERPAEKHLSETATPGVRDPSRQVFRPSGGVSA